MILSVLMSQVIPPLPPCAYWEGNNSPKSVCNTFAPIQHQPTNTPTHTHRQISLIYYGQTGKDSSPCYFHRVSVQMLTYSRVTVSHSFQRPEKNINISTIWRPFSSDVIPTAGNWNAIINTITSYCSVLDYKSLQCRKFDSLLLLPCFMIDQWP